MNWRTLNSLRWPIYVINSVDKAKLPCDAPHWRSPAVSLPIHQKFTQLTHHFHFFFKRRTRWGREKGEKTINWHNVFELIKIHHKNFLEIFFLCGGRKYFVNPSWLAVAVSRDTANVFNSVSCERMFEELKRDVCTRMVTLHVIYLINWILSLMLLKNINYLLYFTLKAF